MGVVKGTDDDDAAAFEEATRGARPIAKGGPRITVDAAPTAAPTAPRQPKARATREPLIAGDDGDPITSAVFTIALLGERIEGRAPGISVELVRRLRAGEPRVAGRLDLHGHAREAALAALERFVEKARADERRALLVIHGRGAHSSEGPVLKPLVWRWLATSRVAADAVLAFASARPADGDDGATLILVRKPPRAARGGSGG